MTALALDHVAFGTTALDADIAFFSGRFGMSLTRRGWHVDLGSPIALMDSGWGLKLELISSSPSDAAGVAHIAWRCADRQEIADALGSTDGGAEPDIFRIDAARAYSAFLTSPGGIRVQLIAYDPGSPDLTGERS